MRMLIHIAAPILIFLAGCDDTTSPQPSDSSPLQEQPTETPIPKDITYTIIDNTIFLGFKRSLNIRLNKRVPEDVLKSIAMELKNSDSNSYERTFIGYYLPEMKVDAGYWATTHFNPDVEVRILGLTVEQERALNQQPTVSSREIIGSWLQDEEPFPGRIIIFREEGALYMEKTYSDGTTGKDQVVEKPSNKGRKFMKRKRTGPDHDYYLVDNHGGLQIWSQDVDGTHVLMLTAKTINANTSKRLKGRKREESKAVVSRGPSSDTRDRWLNTTYSTTVVRTKSGLWQEVDKKTGRVNWEYKEVDRTAEYVELFCPERKYEIRLVAKRMELKKAGKWQSVASGHWAASPKSR